VRCVTVAPGLRDVPLDDSVRILGVQWLKRSHTQSLPSMYVDGYTIIREVADLHSLRKGDHCLVGLPHAVFRTLSPTLDMINAYATSWEAYPVASFHHFVLLDAVASVSSDGPLTEDGRPVRIAEYSDTIVNGWRRVIADGWRGCWRNWCLLVAQPAKFHTPLLKEYLPHFHRASPTPTSSCPGLLVVVRNLSDEQRRETCDAAMALLEKDGEPGGGYRFFTSNCEHVAFMLSTTRRWISPQVPHMLWILFRWAIQLVGLFCLYLLTIVPSQCERAHFVIATGYHLFATVPVSLQVQVELVRLSVYLSSRREEIDVRDYHFLVLKETLRACLVLALAIGLVCMMPRLVWTTGRLRLACLISLSGLGFANLVFNLCFQLCTRALLATCGVPILIFDDHRDPSGRTFYRSATTRSQQIILPSNSTQKNPHVDHSHFRRRSRVSPPRKRRV